MSAMSCNCVICEKLSTKICSGCHLVSYCSVEHQKIHWKTHKNSCKLYEIKCNEKYGRYTIATRDIEPGTIIMSEPAIMIGPKQNTFPICLGCNKRLLENVKKYYCSKCLIFPMCGEECEKILIHAENECIIFAEHKPNFKSIQNFDEGHPAYECIMTLRCLLLKKNNTKKWKKLENMQHQNEIRKKILPDLWHRNEINTVRLLRERCHMKQFSEMDIHTVLGYYDINSFEVKIDQIETSGLFDNTYIMAHDCISNTHHTFTADYKMIVRATIPIKKNELITTTYAHTLDGTYERRKDLYYSKFFNCECLRCKDPTEFGTYFSAIKCYKCQLPNGYLLPINSLCYNSEWFCSECKIHINSKDIIKIINTIKIEIKTLSENIIDSNVLERHEKLLKKYNKNILHPNHYLIIDLESSLLSLYGRMKGWMINELSLNDLERKEMLCHHVMKILNIIEPGLSRIRGVTLYELHAAVYFIANKKFQNGEINSIELKKKLQDVLMILEESKLIFSFDSTDGTMEGTIAKSIPQNIIKIKESIGKL